MSGLIGQKIHAQRGTLQTINDLIVNIRMANDVDPNGRYSAYHTLNLQRIPSNQAWKGYYYRVFGYVQPASFKRFVTSEPPDGPLPVKMLTSSPTPNLWAGKVTAAFFPSPVVLRVVDEGPNVKQVLP